MTFTYFEVKPKNYVWSVNLFMIPNKISISNFFCKLFVLREYYPLEN